MNLSGNLRSILHRSHEQYVQETTATVREERKSAVLFKASGTTHGNFHPASYVAIRENHSWARRLEKHHSHFPGGDVMELDSSNSSDALLMNIFCHPDTRSLVGLLKLLGLETWRTPEFGWDPGFPNETNPMKTECDMRLGDMIVEAKLTESDFQSKAADVVRTYPNVTKLFDLDRLSMPDGQIRNYQLVRNIAAATMLDLRFVLLVDARRPDLIREFMATLLAMNDREASSRCRFHTWQEIVGLLGEDLRTFLELKYAFR
jgi:Restriction Endonuclease associating with ARP